MKKMLKWWFTLMLVLTMTFAFAAGCAPVENGEEGDNGGIEDEGDLDEENEE